MSLLLLIAARPARAGINDPLDTWTANGTVHAIARTGNTVYVGGEFNRVGPYTGGGVPVDSTSGVPAVTYPAVRGTIRTVLSDGSGGWFIGGSFTHVGGVARQGLAHILSNGTLDSGFTCNVTGTVWSLAVVGGTLYVAGNFTALGATPRNHIGSVDATTGAVSGWNPNPDFMVYRIAANATTVYAAGVFTNIGGQPRSNLAGLSATTGLATSFAPEPSNTVNALVLSGTTLYVGGYFNIIGGQSRAGLAAIDTTTTGSATAWDPACLGGVSSLALSGSTLYVAGTFSSLGGQTRTNLGAVSTSTGLATTWGPIPDGPIDSIAVNGTNAYVAGSYTTINSLTRTSPSVISLATGAPGTWSALPDSTVNVVATSGSTVFLGGSFSSISAVTRNGLAAFDATTGTVTSWNPQSGGYVHALEISDDILYVGGYFGSMSGQTRNALAAFDLSTGNLTSWDPNVQILGGTPISDIAVSGNTVYVCGRFDQIGGQPRKNAAAIDATTGVPTSFAPVVGGTFDFSANASAIAVSGNTVYVGGNFFNVNSQARNHLCALNATTGALTSWNPNTGFGTGTVSALALSGNDTIYVGGFFNTMGGATRNYLAEVSLLTDTNNATSWNPNVSYQVRALAISNSNVYVAGFFSTVNGATTRNGGAAISRATGTATAFDPNLQLYGYGIHYYDGTLYYGGTFTSAAGLPRIRFAAFQVESGTPAAAAPAWLDLD